MQFSAITYIFSMFDICDERLDFFIRKKLEKNLPTLKNSTNMLISIFFILCFSKKNNVHFIFSFSCCFKKVFFFGHPNFWHTYISMKTTASYGLTKPLCMLDSGLKSEKVQLKEVAFLWILKFQLIL